MLVVYFFPIFTTGLKIKNCARSRCDMVSAVVKLLILMNFVSGPDLLQRALRSAQNQRSELAAVAATAVKRMRVNPDRVNLVIDLVHLIIAKVVNHRVIKVAVKPTANQKINSQAKRKSRKSLLIQKQIQLVIKILK